MSNLQIDNLKNRLGTKSAPVEHLIDITSVIDLSAASADYLLKVGEAAKVTYSGATSKALRIALAEGFYEMLMYNTDISQGVDAPVYLHPNNTTYNAFYYDEWGGRIGGTNWWGQSASGHTGFRIGWNRWRQSSFCRISTFQGAKSVAVQVGTHDNTPSRIHMITFADWTDYTTAWTSLGTLTFPGATTGGAIIKRVG